MDPDSKQPSPKAAWMPSVAAETLKSSERQLPGGRYGRPVLSAVFVMNWLYLPLTLKADTPTLKWSFVSLWLISSCIVLALWFWQRQHHIEDTEQRSWLDFQFQWKYFCFILFWFGLSCCWNSFSPNRQWSALHLVLASLLLGSLIWLIQSWRQRRTQGP
ncbi:hypothetical protein EHF33_01985 [Deinococcus psychrotolerans]|uniref:Uncharacterized protein n=1 Tax=Deinococcus psychrotolerans TaxID=2489213 RepID=A0A3G8Y8G9_9DEIO|nr:hypothetical protein [Deinococcus psychrotolerans]AZI41669.1 hypothetical protein EHF33_01985 [Deinococcus psychrotolerans]